MRKNRVLLFIVCTYLCFWAGLMLTGVAMYAGATDHVIDIMSTVIAWTPTFVFLALFHKLLPNETTRHSYIKKLFIGRHIGIISVMIVFVQTCFFFLSVFLIGKVTDQSWSSLFQMNLSSLIAALITTLLSGATGEELGWRGFLHFELTDKFGIIKGSLLVGVFWSFWHTPLWFITSGYTGGMLVYFIIAFLISNISTSVMIGILFDQKKNLLIPVIIHYLFNFWAEFYTGERVHLLGVLAVFYLLCAIVMVTYYRKKQRA